MKTLVLAAALVAAVIQPATAQTIRTVCRTVSGDGFTRTVCTTSTLQPVPSLLTPSQQRTAYGFHRF